MTDRPQALNPIRLEQAFSCPCPKPVNPNRGTNHPRRDNISHSFVVLDYLFLINLTRWNQTESCVSGRLTFAFSLMKGTAMVDDPKVPMRDGDEVAEDDIAMRGDNLKGEEQIPMRDEEEIHRPGMNE